MSIPSAMEIFSTKFLQNFGQNETEGKWIVKKKKKKEKDVVHHSDL